MSKHCKCCENNEEIKMSKKQFKRMAMSILRCAKSHAQQEKILQIFDDLVEDVNG